MPSLTLEDIAKKAGVSRATVSRVVNHRTNVNEDVRERVLEIIRQTGYYPHAAAQTLASQRSSTLGLILPHSVSLLFTDPYYSHFTKGVSQACNQHDYTLALFLVQNKEDELKIFPRLARPGMLDGVILQSGHHGDQSLIGRMVDANMPVVMIGRPFLAPNVSYIDVDNVNAAYSAVAHLMRQNRQRIATITGPLASTAGVDRLAGYRKAFEDRGQSVRESLIAEGDFTEVGGYYAMQRLFPAQPDAVFAASDIMAAGAMRAVLEAGLRVPEDIAFVGFDDLPVTSLVNVALTTVRQPVVQLGVQAVELLLDVIENGATPPRRIIIDTELVIRESCGASRR
ncbi:MAG TPA: LacI family DNA-binding transcriptional regulator [Anaerolineaceae bacterium]|nr:LacI family DNA-binding transcriptional regulator [Anaerolineaceae bacterium]